MLNWVTRLGIAAAIVLLAMPADASKAHHAARSHAVVAHAAIAHAAIAHAVVVPIAQAAVEKVDVIGQLIDPVHAAPVGTMTRVPYGWADFCSRRPEECRVDVAQPIDVVMTPEVMQTLEGVNARANAEIEPVSNLDHWGTLLDHWDYPVDGKGDCKIYALWKRRLLLDMGFPRQALLMTIVRDLEGNGHTILTVKTDRGDIILDNMVGELRWWDDTGYKFVKRQSQADPNVWVSVGPATMPTTTAGVN